MVLIPGKQLNQSLGEHSDVNLTNLQATDVLVFDGAFWINTTVSGVPPHPLNDHTDVTLTSPAADEVLTFNGSQWVNQPTTLPPQALNDHTDVDTTGQAATDVLTFDGANWVPAATQFIAHPLSQHTDTVISSPQDGQVLVFSAGFWRNETAQQRNLNDLGDVDTTGQSTNDVLTYNGSLWVPAVPPLPPHTLDDHSDANLGAAVDDSLVTRSSGLWIPTSQIKRSQAVPSFSQCLVTDIKTSNYDAVPGDLIGVDATAAKISITMPASPQENDIIGVARLNSTGEDVVIDGNGNQLTLPRINLISQLTGQLADAPQVTLFADDEIVFYQWIGTRWFCVHASNTIPAAGAAQLYGDPSNFSPGATFTPIQGWPNVEESLQFQGAANPATGVITFPADGLYQVNANIIGQQGNNNKELSILYWARIGGGGPNAGDFIIGVFDVATDKTSWRTYSSVFDVEVQQNETIQLGVSIEGGSIGTYNMSPCLFSIEYKYFL